MNEWEHLAEWWLDEATDPAYTEDVHPLVADLLGEARGLRVLEVGSGEGSVLRLVRSMAAEAVGMDISARLARLAGTSFVARLPSLSAVRDAAFDVTLVVLVVEHLATLEGLFEELARVTGMGGRCLMVVNHPLMTAPGAAPITDPSDGEVFLRPGAYFEPGFTDEPAGSRTVRFHHRPLGTILGAAATAGWCLDHLVERGPSERHVRRDPSYAGHEHIPRLLGIRWRRAA